MELSYFYKSHFDLITPDGKITALTTIDRARKLATVLIENISPNFVGYKIDPLLTFFNLKSTLAQLGINAIGREYEPDQNNHSFRVKVELEALSPLADEFLN